MRPFILFGLTLGGAAALGVACGERDDSSSFSGDASQGDAAAAPRADATLGSIGDG